MAYSAQLRRAVGDVRACLAGLGLMRQGKRFTAHGEHEPDAHAPLVLVACSGGRDSMALAAVSATVCGMLGLRCGAAIIDHGLAAQSAQVTRDAAARLEALGLSPVLTQRVQVDRASGQGLEAAARAARYDALVGMAMRHRAAAVLLAHTRDDQAEGVLIRMSRSGGLEAMAGMPPYAERDGVRFARPFLGLTRAQTTAICRQLDLAWWDDPTNGDDVPAGQELDASYPLRSRIRHDLVPALTRCYGHDPSAMLARGAAGAAEDADYLRQAAQRTAAAAMTVVQPGACVRLDADLLAGEHPAIRRRVIVLALESAGADQAARAHVEAIERLAVDWHGQRPLSLPSGYTANRKGHVIEVCKDSAHANR